MLKPIAVVLAVLLGGCAQGKGEREAGICMISDPALVEGRDFADDAEFYVLGSSMHGAFVFNEDCPEIRPTLRLFGVSDAADAETGKLQDFWKSFVFGDPGLSGIFQVTGRIKFIEASVHGRSGSVAIQRVDKFVELTREDGKQVSRLLRDYNKRSER